MQHTNILKLIILLNWMCSLSVGLDNGRISQNDFCYEDESCGPNSVDWKDQCKTGTRQSPINLPYVPNFQRTRRVDLEFNDYYCSDEFWISDNGHTIRVTLEPEPTSLGKMYGFEFSYPYIFAEIHFHWGHDSNGSEHAIDNEFFAMEAHLVHYDAKYDNYTEAVNSGDKKAVAVVAVFIAEGSDVSYNSAFETIAINIPRIGRNATRVRQRLDLSSFLPGRGDNFYRYFGSLTTPDCNEVVQWTVVEDPIRVSPSLIQKFRNVKKSRTRRIGENVRPIQERGDRIIMYLAKK